MNTLESGVEAYLSDSNDSKQVLIHKFVMDQAKSKLIDDLVEFISPRNAKIWNVASQILSTQDANAPSMDKFRLNESSNMRLKSALINHFFNKPYEVITPTIRNFGQNRVYHSSKFDIMQNRYY